MTAPFTPLSRLSVALLGAVTLAGCTPSFLKDEPETRACPDVKILSDAETLTAFRPGAGRDLTDVMYEAKFVGYRGSCLYDTDSDSGTGELSVEVRLNMKARRGPANTTATAPVQYFVSITDPARNVLTKKTFDVQANFPGNRTQAKIDDQPVYLTLPIAKGQTGADYTVFIGFQLTRAQLDYNRAAKHKN